MIKIAICDDCLQSVAQIYKLVTDYSLNNTLSRHIEVCRYTNSIDLMDAILVGKHFDILLLDIIMPTFSGMELAAHIRSSDQAAKIIFLTASPEFAIEAYSVNAFYYLLKPILKDQLFSILDKACDDVSSNLNQNIIVKAKTGLFKVLFSELIYVEVINKTVYLHLKNGDTIESQTSILKIETDLLADPRFVKPHRSYLVNLDYVINLSKTEITTIHNQHILVSRIAYPKIKEAYLNYSFR